MSLVQHLPGSSVLSSFRRDRLLAQLKEAGLPVADISARYEHFVNTDAALTAAQQQQLAQLLDYGTPVTGDTPAKSLELLVIPRLGTISRGPARPPTSPTTAAWTPCAASSAACAT